MEGFLHINVEIFTFFISIYRLLLFQNTTLRGADQQELNNRVGHMFMNSTHSQMK